MFQLFIHQPILHPMHGRLFMKPHIIVTWQIPPRNFGNNTTTTLTHICFQGRFPITESSNIGGCGHPFCIFHENKIQRQKTFWTARIWNCSWNLVEKSNYYRTHPDMDDGLEAFTPACMEFHDLDKKKDQQFLVSFQKELSLHQSNNLLLWQFCELTELKLEFLHQIDQANKPQSWCTEVKIATWTKYLFQSQNTTIPAQNWLRKKSSRNYRALFCGLETVSHRGNSCHKQ